MAPLILFRRIASRLVAVLLATLPLQALAVDIRIVGGELFDGTNANGVSGQVVDIQGDQIVYVGPPRAEAAAQVIDASGMVVAPGFIDPHTHAYTELSRADTAANAGYLYQGVSTVFVGNDGGDGRYRDIAEVLAQHALGTNVGIFAGHGSIRRQVMGGDDRAPTTSPSNLNAYHGLLLIG